MSAVARWGNAVLKLDSLKLDALKLNWRIVIPVLFIAAATCAFAALASVARSERTLVFDRFLITALRDPFDTAVPIGPRWFRSLMLDMTAWGNVPSLTVLTIIITGYLLVMRKAAIAAFLVSTITGGMLLGSALKSAFHRPRPDVVTHLVEVHTTSFPSGHAMYSAVVFLTLGALLSRVHTQQRVRVYILSVAILLTLTVGFSRVYLGVHWSSDVLAGWMVGSVWATLCWMLARRLQRRRTLEPPNSPR